jgi:hypothetical protein
MRNVPLPAMPVVAWAAVSSGCIPEALDHFPPHGSSAKTTVLLVLDHGAVNGLVTTSTADLALQVENGDRLTLLYYDSAIADLGIHTVNGSKGLIATPQLGQPGSLLPKPEAAYAAMVTDGRPTDWTSVEPNGDALYEMFRQTTVLPNDCELYGGCYPASHAACASPCPDRAPIAAPDPPEPVEAPDLGCSAHPGWRTRKSKEFGVLLCDPPASTSSCTDPRQVAFFDSGCEAIGDPCPAGPYASPPAGRSAVYVDPNASPGGSGTQAAPFVTIRDAVGAASQGDVILLSRGRHAIDPSVSFSTSNVSIVGACTEMTTVVGSIMLADAAAIEIANATLGESGTPASIVVSNATAFELDRLRLAPGASGITVLASTGTIARVVIEEPAGDAVSIDGSPGIEIRDLVVDRPSGKGLAIYRTIASVEGLVVRGTADGAGPSCAVDVARDARMAINGVLLDGVLHAPLCVSSAWSTVVDGRVRDTVSSGGDLAFSIAGSATVSISRSIFERNATQTLVMSGESRVRVENSFVSGAINPLNNAADISMSHVTGPVALDHVAIEGYAVMAVNAECSPNLRFDHLMVSGNVIAGSPNVQGEGMTLLSCSTTGAHLEVRGALNRGITLDQSGDCVSDPSRASLQDIIIRGTGQRHPTDPKEGASALRVADGAAVSLNRVLVDGDTANVLNVEKNTTTATVTSLTATAALQGGLRVVGGARLRLERASFVHCPGYGLIVDPGSTRQGRPTVYVSDITIRQVPASDMGGGEVVVTIDDVLLHVERFLISDAAAAGFVILSGVADVMLTDGEIDRSPYGVAIPPPPYDPTRSVVKTVMHGVPQPFAYQP